ncbi:MAG: glycosyltransferase [Candidatus Shapirobacteria bacterium]|jgi:glycosyltransferase involved in cell wall biosynthesis
MRIAFFSDAYHPRVSGQVASIDEFCKCLTERGHDVCIVCPSYPPERMHSRPDPFRTIRVPSGSAIVSEDDRLAIPWRLGEAERAVDEFRPQAVHVQTEFSIGALGRRYCRRRGIPIVSTCHTYYEQYIQWYLPLLPEFLSRPAVRAWLRKVYAEDDLIVTPSRHICDVLRGYGIDREFAIIPTGVDERMFYPRPEQAAKYRKELERNHPGFTQGALLIYAGRISQEKNLEILAEAMARMLRDAPGTRLLMVGDGPHKTDFQQMFRRRGLHDKVIWTGLLPRESLPVIYSAADIFVFPSVTETQGLVTIEAMLCGTPIVGVNRMGTAEILEGDAGGFLTENDAADFAEKTLALIRDPALRARKAAEAVRAAQRWTIGHACDQMEEVYQNLFGE